MKIIYKPDDGRISVAEAKRLIYNALPQGNGAEVYMHIDAEGNPVWDGPIELKEVPEADMYDLAGVVLDMCKLGKITPRFRYRPTRTGYSGNSDDAYLLDHADFVVMAQMLECRVIVGEAPATRETENPAPAIPESASNEATTKTTSKRRTWQDVCNTYIVDVMQNGQYATCKALYRALEAKAGSNSPFDKGTGSNFGSLFVREIAQPLSLKTVQNEWKKLRALANK